MMTANKLNEYCFNELVSLLKICPDYAHMVIDSDFLDESGNCTIPLDELEYDDLSNNGKNYLSDMYCNIEAECATIGDNDEMIDF